MIRKITLCLLLFVLLNCKFAHSQNEIQNINTVFNQIFLTYTKAFKDKDVKLFGSVVDTNYIAGTNSNLFFSFLLSLDKRYDVSFYDTITNVYLESDTVTYKDCEYVLVSYDAVRKLRFNNTNPETSTQQHHKYLLENIYYRMKANFHLDKKDTTLYSHRPGEFILKKPQDSDNWTLIDIGHDKRFKELPGDLLEILFQLKQLSCFDCQNLNLTPKQIGEYVFRALQEFDYKKVYCQLGITRKRLEEIDFFRYDTLSIEEKKEWFDSFLYKKTTIEEDLYELLLNIDFRKTELVNVYAEILPGQEPNKETSNVIVEYIYEGDINSFEIECGQINGTWLIVDDINR